MNQNNIDSATLARIYGAYWGCSLQWVVSDGETGEKWDEPIVYDSHLTIDFLFKVQAKLILTPLTGNYIQVGTSLHK